jgi:hypothetical protein
MNKNFSRLKLKPGNPQVFLKSNLKYYTGLKGLYYSMRFFGLVFFSSDNT